MSRVSKPFGLSLAAALTLAAPLAGCISFGAKPPPSLLTITSAQMVPAGQTQTSVAGHTLTVYVPVVPQALANNRVPVQTGDTQIAYVRGAQWVELPARMFARLLSDTAAARTGRVVLSGTQSFSDPGAQLSGELRTFGVRSDSNEAVVTFEGSLIRAQGNLVEKRLFEARVPVAAVDAPTVGAALNQAANQVAGEVADWVGR